MVPHGLRGSQVRAPPPRCVAGAAPNGSPRRPASVPTKFSDWLRRPGRWGRDQKGLGAPLRESSCLATGRWPSGYPAQRAREGARPQPTRPGLQRGSSPGPQALPGAPGSRIGPGSRKTWSQLWGSSSRPQPFSPTGGEAGRLTLTRSLCRAPAAIMSVREMEDPAIPYRQRRVQGLWGIQRIPAAFLGGPRSSASRKGPGLVFPKSDLRSEAVSPSLCPSWKP